MARRAWTASDMPTPTTTCMRAYRPTPATPPFQVTKKFGKAGMDGRVYHKPYLLELGVAFYYLVRGAHSRMHALACYHVCRSEQRGTRGLEVICRTLLATCGVLQQQGCRAHARPSLKHTPHTPQHTQHTTYLFTGHDARRLLVAQVAAGQLHLDHGLHLRVLQLRRPHLVI